MTIYIDVVLIENLIMNYIILFATGIILKIKIKHIRLFLASLLGAIYSIVAYAGILEVYTSFWLKILLSVIIVYIAYNPQTMKKMWKDLLIFYLISFAFGGVAFALIYIVRPQDILMKNGLFLGTYTIKTVILGAIVAFFICVGGFTVVKKRISKKDMFCNIEIWLNDKEIKTKAMIDSGNMLKEPITNTPVVVVEHTLLYEIIPKEILNNLNQIIGGDFEKISEENQKEYLPRLKFIPFSSLGKQNGMLIGIKAQKVKILTEEQETEKENVILGLYTKSLTKKGEYRALIGMELI